MSSIASVLLCAAIFGGLHFAINLFRILYWKMPWPLVPAFIETLVISLVGAFGFWFARFLLARDFRHRTVGFIAVVSYFVSYSVTNLVQSVSTSPWIFIVCLFAISIIVTVRIGPKWDQRKVE